MIHGSLAQGNRSREMSRGRRLEVAVGCWFTSTGRAIPQMVKYEDEEGCLQVLRDIQILYAQKDVKGALYQRYDCCTRWQGREQTFTLLYHPMTNSWHMIL